MADEEEFTRDIINDEHVLVYPDGRIIRDPDQPSTLAWLVGEQTFHNLDALAEQRAARLARVEHKRDRLASRDRVPTDKRAL